ncbi:hypothetical protein NHX12_015013 [Muraenolepis orangiensis]|uniref:Transmembrane protein 131 n=1 Tax=Muraenolepis orangiensis TaxID=630683 RepID=A0A9Q0I4F0_9TELE|nr:hypothetical protein NHX12_015013 [Muraenolepis orangiensis]
MKASFSFPLPGANSRPIRFEPPMLDFHEQPVGMPKMEKVYLHNPSPEEISLISISATTAHFHASFFQNRIIPSGGNTSFDVVFLARVVGNVENTLFINTSHHGVFTYQVFGVGIPNPYRLRPFIGARVPVNSSFSPLINIHNPHSEPLQVVEMYSSGGDLHLELPTGQQGGTLHLWEIPPFETKGVMRASFSSREADNHTAFIRIKTNASDPDQFIILPVEVEVTSAPGIYSSIEMLDFGTLRSQDKPKQLNLHLLNSGSKDVQITSVRASPSNEAVTIDFKAITLKAGENKYTKVASISFDASKAQKASQYLGFDHTVTLFHIRDSGTDVLVKPIHLTNTFHFAIRVHQVGLPEEASAMFKVLNFTDPVLIPSQGSLYIFSLEFQPRRPSTHVDSNILLVTNASKFHLPIRAYTGFLEPLALPPSLSERFLDFGVLSATDTSSILLAVFNKRGNRTSLLTRARELLNATASLHKTVILASGYYAVFRVTLSAKGLEGHYNAAIHLTTDYEILTVPVEAVIAVGTLTSHPKHIVLPQSFPGKTVHQSFSIISSFSQRVRLLHIRSLSDDKRFFYRRLKTSRDELEPKRKSKVAKIYFDASLQCGDYCYVGLPFILKSEAPGPGVSLQEDMWDADVDLYQMLNKRWKQLKENSQHIAEAVFEANADLQKNMQTRVLAQLKWPSIINSSRHVIFPLTSVNSSSILPLALYANPAAITHTLAQSFPMERLPHFDASTLEFQIHRNQSTVPRSSGGFVEGAPRPFVYNVPLRPEEQRRLRLRFSPLANHSVTSLLVLRNNLTVVEFLVVQGQGCHERLKVGGKYPGSGGFLRFKMVESHLKECTDKNRPKEPNFTLRRSFKVENTGQLTIQVQALEINGRPCEGFGFKVLHCQGFSLEPNASRDLVIIAMFLLVVVTAYLEALGIWEGFKKRLSYEASGLPLETGKPFDLREIVRLQSNASQPVSKNSRGGGTSGRPSPQAPPPPVPPPPPPQQQQAPPHPATPRASDSTALAGQHTGRKARGGAASASKQPQHHQSPAVPASPRDPPAAGPEEQDYAKLLEAMDKDLERPELGGAGGEEPEAAPCLQIKSGAKVKLPRKPKLQRRREEAELRPKVAKSQGGGEEPPREETDDSSSITTDTSNTDTEDLAVKKSQPPAPEKEKETPAEQSFKPKKHKQQVNPKEKSSGSSSEGESNVSPPPEWDCVPLHKTTNAVDSLHLISMQTMHADPFLKSDLGSRAPPPTKAKLIKSVSLPGQNGNPTFAAVTAGYDKSPGGSSSGRGSLSRAGVAPTCSMDSDCSDSPIGNGRAPSLSNTFSAFGTSNLFNLSGVFSGMTSGRSVADPHPSWSDFGPMSSSSAPGPSSWPSEALEPWPCTSPTASSSSSMLGSSSLWSPSPPFSSSIWSTSADSSPLHTFPSAPPPGHHLADLLMDSSPSPSSVVSSVSSSSPGPGPVGQMMPPSPGQLSPAYNPWSMWRPTLGGGGASSRRCSEPWPNLDPNNAN